MREYETIYVLKPDLPSDQVSNLKDKVAKIITSSKGHILSHADWGKRRLAYDVQKFRYAQFIYFQYLSAGDQISELERILKYDDSVLKFLTVKLEDKVNIEERLAKPIDEPVVPEDIYSASSGDSYSSRRSYSGGMPEEKKEEPKKETPEKGEKSSVTKKSPGDEASENTSEAKAPETAES